MESMCSTDSDPKFAASSENGLARLHSAAVPIAQHSSMNGRAPANGSLSSSVSSYRYTNKLPVYSMDEDKDYHMLPNTPPNIINM